MARKAKTDLYVIPEAKFSASHFEALAYVFAISLTNGATGKSSVMDNAVVSQNGNKFTPVFLELARVLKHSNPAFDREKFTNAIYKRTDAILEHRRSFYKSNKGND